MIKVAKHVLFAPCVSVHAPAACSRVAPGVVFLQWEWFHSNSRLKVVKPLVPSVFQLSRNLQAEAGDVCAPGWGRGVSPCMSFVFTRLLLGVSFSVSSVSTQWAHAS